VLQPGCPQIHPYPPAGPGPSSATIWFPSRIRVTDSETVAFTPGFLNSITMISVYDRMLRHCHSSIPTPAFVAGNAAPLIDERAARRGRIATEGGHESAGVQSAGISAIPASVPHRNARGARRDRGRARSSMTTAPAWEGTPVRHVLRWAPELN